MHFVDAKNILTTSGGHCAKRIIYFVLRRSVLSI